MSAQMFHNAKVYCKIGPIKNLEVTAMTYNLKVIYPSNWAGCNEDCLCVNSHKCPRIEHKEHLKQLNSECSVAREFQCQDHEIAVFEPNTQSTSRGKVVLQYILQADHG